MARKFAEDMPVVAQRLVGVSEQLSLPDIGRSDRLAGIPPRGEKSLPKLMDLLSAS